MATATVAEQNRRALVIPTRLESQAVLRSLPGAYPEPEWDVPTWHVGDLLLVEPGIGPELTAVSACPLPHHRVE